MAADIRSIINEIGSEFFTVTFTKKDGSIRTMNCRKNVTKHLKGGVSTTAKYDHLLTVYDVKAEGYRNINLNTIIEVKANGNVFIR
jgi:hypothetical protein